jgi:transcription elongation factor Elf1
MTDTRKQDGSDSLDELVSCPFCGGEAIRRVRNNILTVGCDECVIYFDNHVRLGCLADSQWNNRAS